MLNQIQNVLICEDHPFLQIGLEMSLRKLLPNLNLVSVASSATEALSLASRLTHELFIVDLGLPDISGDELTRELKKLYPSAKILVITGSNSPVQISKALKTGVSGILHKSLATSNFLLEALNSLGSNVPFLDTKIKQIMGEDNCAGLTNKEYEILTKIVQGQSNQQIADALGCALTTVRFHRANILSKAKVKNAAELSAWFLGAKQMSL